MIVFVKSLPVISGCLAIPSKAPAPAKPMPIPGPITPTAAYPSANKGS